MGLRPEGSPARDTAHAQGAGSPPDLDSARAAKEPGETAHAQGAGSPPDLDSARAAKEPGETAHAQGAGSPYVVRYEDYTGTEKRRP